MLHELAFLPFCAAGLLLAPAAARAQQAEPAPSAARHRPDPARRPTPAPALPTPCGPAPWPKPSGAASWHGRVRNYIMATWNRGYRPDYYANGLGAGLRFETAPLHGVQVGAGGFFWVSLGSDNLADRPTRPPGR